MVFEPSALELSALPLRARANLEPLLLAPSPNRRPGTKVWRAT